MYCGNQKQESKTKEQPELVSLLHFRTMEILSCMMVPRPLVLHGSLTHVQHVLLEAKELGCTSLVPHLRANAIISCASLLILVEV